jgi:hypothetical protein
MSAFSLSGKKAMPHNQNTFIERDLFEQFISKTQLNPAVSQQISMVHLQSFPLGCDINFLKRVSK